MTPSKWMEAKKQILQHLIEGLAQVTETTNALNEQLSILIEQ